jgi:hypothetical protein
LSASMNYCIHPEPPPECQPTETGKRGSASTRALKSIFAFAKACPGNMERILFFHSDIIIHPHASMTAVETIKVYHTGRKSRWGIYGTSPRTTRIASTRSTRWISRWGKCGGTEHPRGGTRMIRVTASGAAWTGRMFFSPPATRQTQPSILGSRQRAAQVTQGQRIREIGELLR